MTWLQKHIIDTKSENAQKISYVLTCEISRYTESQTMKCLLIIIYLYSFENVKQHTEKILFLVTQGKSGPLICGRKRKWSEILLGLVGLSLGVLTCV